MRYKLHKLGETKVSSAYCPVCIIKTVEIRSKLEPQYIREPVSRYMDGLVSPENLCCKGKCIETYRKGLDYKLSTDCHSKESIETMLAYGMLPLDYEDS